MSNPQTELGAVITASDAQRDAVHIAVAPVFAAETLYPGQRVGLLPKTLICTSDALKIGIVDPFLPGPVYKDQRFWLFLFPNTITGLNHVWTHPAFDAAAAPAPSSKEISEKWLRAFCRDADCPSYETVMVKAAAVADDTYDNWDVDYLHFKDYDAHGEIPPEFWDHVSIVLGRPIKGTRATSFSCAC